MSDLRKRVMHWVWDGRPEWTWSIRDEWIGRPLCWLFGHEAICDQCHKPDHDYCCWCRKLMPGRAHRVAANPNTKEDR
jgi:hypothetical protein